MLERNPGTALRVAYIMPPINLPNLSHSHMLFSSYTVLCLAGSGGSSLAVRGR